MLTDLGTSQDRLNRFVSRRWSIMAKHLKQVLDKAVIVAEDEGRLSHDAVAHYSTSCTFVNTI